MAPPVNVLNKLIGENRFEYPTGIALSDGLQHFMVISEVIFKAPKKTDDAFQGSSGLQNYENITQGDESKDYYERGKSFVLHLPPGSLKTQYSADYADVNLGIFGDILSQNASQITDDLKEHFSDFATGNTGYLQNVFNLYNNMRKDVTKRAMPYYDSEDFGNDFAERIKFNVASAVGALAPSGAKGEQIASMSMRTARNPYTSLIFTGIKKLRQHNFNFEFNPKSAIESKRLMKIIINLKYGMLPGLNKLEITEKIPLPIQKITRNPHVDNPGGSYSTEAKTIVIKNDMDSAFFTFPYSYRIQFYSNQKENPYLHRIGNSFLMSLKTKYSPRFFEENGMPTSIGLQLQFKENFTLDRSHAEEY